MPLLLGWWEVVAVARDSPLRCRTVARGYVIHASSVQISQLLESLLLSRHPAWPGRAALIEPRTLERRLRPWRFPADVLPTARSCSNGQRKTRLAPKSTPWVSMTVLVGELGCNAADRHPGSFSWPRLRHGISAVSHNPQTKCFVEKTLRWHWAPLHVPFFECFQCFFFYSAAQHHSFDHNKFLVLVGQTRPVHILGRKPRSRDKLFSASA